MAAHDHWTSIKDLVVCASKTARDYTPIAGLCYGKAIALVDVTKTLYARGGYVWFLENPRLIRPFDVHASASFFYVRDEVVVLPNGRESYEEFVLPTRRKATPATRRASSRPASATWMRWRTPLGTTPRSGCRGRGERSFPLSPYAGMEPGR